MEDRCFHYFSEVAPIGVEMRFDTMLLWQLLVMLSAVALQSPPTAVDAPSANQTPETKFSDVTIKSGINFEYQSSHTSKHFLLETMGSGVALFDYDNDGRLDIFIVNGAPLDDSMSKGTMPHKTNSKYWNRLYHQKSDGTFEDVTEVAGLQGEGYGMGVAVGDYDNDGFEDLYVTAYGGNKLYHNNGNGTFTDVSQTAGVIGGGWSTSAAWVDLDQDGLLDLVVLRYLQWDFDDIWCGEHKKDHRAYCHPDIFKSIAPLIYHNDGKGHFTEVAANIGLSTPGKGLGLAIADYDRDGKIDLFIANDSMAEFLYHNRGNGTFDEVGLISEVAVDGEGHTYAGMGTDFADYNNDGLPDLIVSDLANQTYALYQNNGNGNFTYSTQSSGLGRITLLHSGWGLRFFDFDNDGWKDLIIAQGHDLETIEMTSPNLRYREPLLLLRNTGNNFVDVSASAGSVFQQTWVGRGLATGDIDNDGKIDFIVTDNGGPIHLLHNETSTQNHWLLLNLIGHKSNRDGIGAEVKVITATRSQVATVSTSSSYLSASDKRLHFGLAHDTVAKTIEIRWPSGITQTLTGVLADRIVSIDEPSH